MLYVLYYIYLQVILGMGAFAIENMRTAFERGAAHVTLLCRRRGTVCPQLVDWLNFIRPWEARDRPPRPVVTALQHMVTALGTYGCSPEHLRFQVRDHQPRHATAGDAEVLQAWRGAYDASGAVRPECWQQGLLKPDGHTVSVSDLFFVAHHLGMMSVELGEAACLEPGGVRTNTGKLLEAGVVVKAPQLQPQAATPRTQAAYLSYLPQAVGFETNAANSRMLGRGHMRPNGLVERDLWLLAEPHLDAGAFTSPFGSSYLNVVTYRARSMVCRTGYGGGSVNTRL